MRERFTRLFFYYFFRSLLVAIAIGEWAVVAWLLRASGVAVPGWLHFAMPAAFYAANLMLVRLPHKLPWPARRAVEVYTAYAFTSVFGFAFLLFNTAAWTVLGFLTDGVSWATGPQTAAIVDLSLRGYESSTTLGLAAIGLLFTYGYTFGQREVVVTQHRVRFRRAGTGLHGLRIAQVSDIHIGRYMSADLLEHFVDRVNRLEADVIVVTGDLLDNVRDIPWGFPVLGKLRAPHGVFTILGNHDVFAGADAVEAGLRRHTAHTVLRDAVATIRIDGAPLHVVGVNDLGRDWARGVVEHPGLSAVWPGLPEDEPVLLLAHRPDLFPQAVRAGIELTLSGHTHGGQLSLPTFRGRPLTLARFMTPYDRGLYCEGDSALYVNLGIGCTAQRIRIFAPREISVFEIDAG
jgi:predicted MPP superfamily phosphohydrolase